MVRAILFDCFGVLVGRGFKETYRGAGGDPLADRVFIHNLLGQSNLGLISEPGFHEALASQLGITPKEWLAATEQVELLNVELLEYIEALHHGHKTAILSNANTGVVQRKLGPEWLERCFDVVVVSAEVGKVKPNPAIYAIVAERLEIPPAECVVVDDSRRYVEAAEAAGMQAILYRGFDQLKAELDPLL